MDSIREVQNILSVTKLDNYGVETIAGDASKRRYFRLKSGQNSLILMDSSNELETLDAFMRVRSFLYRNNFSVPQLYDFNLPKGYLVLEDLGTNTLNHILPQHPEQMQLLYEHIIDLLIYLQNATDMLLPAFDSDFFLYEMRFFPINYFSYLGRALSTDRIDQFKMSWESALAYLKDKDSADVFVHKDFHVGNLFWLPDRPGVRNIGMIDFQAARVGSKAYDLTSILYDCRFPIPQNLRHTLFDLYVSTTAVGKEFRDIADIYVAQRNIKILGNFTYIYQQTNNPYYLQFLPQIWIYIRDALKNPILSDVKKWIDDEGIMPEA